MKLKRTGGVMSALLTFALLLIGVVVPAGTATANTAQFALSASSVRVGGSILVAEVDACPPPAYDEMDDYYIGRVDFGIYDANGTMRGSGSATLDPQGHWGQVWVSVEARRVTNVDPEQIEEAPLPGNYQLRGACSTPETVVHYEAQNVEVTGASPYITHGIGVIGQSLQITPSEPCPAGSDTVELFSDNQDMLITNQKRALGNSNAWSLDTPDWHPQDRYYIRVRCLEGNSVRLRYDEVIADFVSPERHNVAMGDSYSSGVGTFNYDASSGDCRRSPESYVPYVATQRNLGTPFFVACGGAQTADFYGQNPVTGEARQLNALTNATRYVTLTIGGNDAGFGEVMSACAHYPGHDGWGCANDTSVVNALNTRVGTLAGTASVSAPDGRQITPLADVFADVAAEAPGAKIYVGGYPRLFGDDIANYTTNANAPGGAQCVMSPGATVSFSDAQWLNQVANDLNDVIEDAVGNAQANGVDVTFVPAALFSTHGLCDSSDSWLNGVVLDDPPSLGYKPESLHPTAEGYQNGYGVAFATIVS